MRLIANSHASRRSPNSPALDSRRRFRDRFDCKLWASARRKLRERSDSSQMQSHLQVEGEMNLIASRSSSANLQRREKCSVRISVQSSKLRLLWDEPYSKPLALLTQMTFRNSGSRLNN